jgi:pimeloyl-ACP methyl ester carboxylesterase
MSWPNSPVITAWSTSASNVSSKAPHSVLPCRLIAYDISEEGPLVLLAHGLGDVRRVYRFLAPTLIDAGYRVATMDMRGHGESSVDWGSYTRTDGAQDMLALVRHLGGTATIIGHSFAGGSAVIAAAQEPALTTGIVLIDPYTRPLQINPVQLAVLKPFLRNATLSASITATPTRR